MSHWCRSTAVSPRASYDLASRVTGKSDTTGHSLTYDFDSAKRPTSVTQAAPMFSGTCVVSYLLGLDSGDAHQTP